MAAAHNYLNDNASNSQNRVVAFFQNRDDAYRALSMLKDAGFETHTMGLAVGRDQQGTSGTFASATDRDDTSFWQKVKDFFSGESDESEHHGELRDAGGDWGWSEERYGYYEEGIASGGAVVTVTGDRIEEARRILQECGGDLRDTGFESGASTRNATARNTTATTGNNLADIGERRIQLRGEMLRTYKDRVQRGEVRLRKEVVTENRSVDVPVTREELVIERTAGEGKAATGEIGTGEEIRVPLSEERVRVEKQPVVNEEVRVGKRQVQGSKQVSDQVRHEELRVDKQGDVDTSAAETPRKRKNPAA